MCRILVDVCHPVWVHFFRNAIERWRSEGCEVIVAGREKDCLVDLLVAYDIPHEVLTSAGNRGLVKLAWEMVERDWKLLRLIRKFKPDVIVTANGACAAQAGWLARVPVVLFADGELATIENRLGHPFAKVICRSAFEGTNESAKTRTYNSFPQLAYLRPDRFRPEPDALREAGIDPDEPYSLLRLVAWTANHDTHISGIPDPVKLVHELEKETRVFISHERELPPEIADRSMKIPPHLYLQLIYHAQILLAEGGNVMEAGVLGTPNLFMVSANFKLWDNMIAEGVIRKVDTQDELTAGALEILRDENAKPAWRERAQAFANKYDDLSDFQYRVVLETAGCLESAKPDSQPA